MSFSDEISFLTLDAIMNSWENAIGIDRITLDITGDLASAAVLTRLRYWFGSSKKDGQSRSKIRKEGKIWMARKDEEWWEECGITCKQIKRIKVQLKELELIDIKVFRFNGLTIAHWNLNIEKYVELYNKHVSKNVYALAQRDKAVWPKGTKRFGPKGQSINKNSTHDPYSYSLETKNKDCKSRVVQESLIYEDVNIVFSSEAQAFGWLINFGYKDRFGDRQIVFSPASSQLIIFTRAKEKKDNRFIHGIFHEDYKKQMVFKNA